jgi:porin
VNTALRRSFVLLAAAAASPAFADDPKPENAPNASGTPQQQPAAGQQQTPPAQQQPPAAQPQAKEKEAAAPIQPAGSSDDINAELDKARPRPAGILPNGPVSILDRWIDDFNDRMDKAMALKFGAAYTTVYQRASDGEEKDAAGGDADLFARWRVLGGEKDGTRSVLGVNGEYRHDFGEQVPKDLSNQFDSLWRTTNGFGVQDPELVQAWWEQHLADDKLVLTIGKLDVDNFYNKYRYQSDSTAFMSQAFSSNPARKHPGNGLGFNALARVANDWYVTAGVHDANGNKAKSGFHTIDEGDVFVAAEVGWTPTFEDFGKGNYSLDVWHTDEATIEGFPSDKGVALSCEQEMCKHYVPFLRASWSDGDATGISYMAEAGIGLEGVVRAKEDLTGIGVVWAKPDDPAFRDQFGGEVFHRFQISPDMQLTVGYQYVVDPAKAPSSNHDPVGIFEIRLRIAF